MRKCRSLCGGDKTFNEKQKWHWGPNPSIISALPFIAGLFNTVWARRGQREAMTLVRGHKDNQHSVWPIRDVVFIKSQEKKLKEEKNVNTVQHFGFFFPVLKQNYSLSESLQGTNSLSRLKGLQQKQRDVFSVRGADHGFCPVFTMASLRSIPARWPLFHKETRGREMALRRCSGVHQKTPEALLTARVWTQLSPQCLTCASKRDVTRKWYTHTIFFKNIIPSHPLCFGSCFQLFLLFPRLLTRLFIFPPAPSRPLLVHIAPRESLKFSEIEMCLVSCPRRELKISLIRFYYFLRTGVDWWFSPYCTYLRLLHNSSLSCKCVTALSSHAFSLSCVCIIQALSMYVL